PLCYRFGNSFVHGTMARQFSSSIAKALLIGSALCIVAPAVPLGGLAQARPAAVPFDREIAEFYRARAGAPLWFAPNSGRAAEQLVQLLASAQADHLNPRRYDVRGLARATADARSGNPAAVQRAEAMLSSTFVTYAGDLRHDPGIGIIYVDKELKPNP